MTAASAKPPADSQSNLASMPPSSSNRRTGSVDLTATGRITGQIAPAAGPSLVPATGSQSHGVTQFLSKLLRKTSLSGSSGSSSSAAAGVESREEDLGSLVSEAEKLLLGIRGKEKDQKVAVKLLRRAAVRGFARAEAILGFCNEFGLGLEGEDFKAAEALYVSAAAQGEGLARARLAFLRKYGRPGVKIDRVEAEDWIKKVRVVGPQSVKWLTLAADEGNMPSGELDNTVFSPWLYCVPSMLNLPTQQIHTSKLRSWRVLP
ncbi:hypothetical protein HDU93_001677 [Gonapodya sp. JEL0774]|nr:hypothetical protein HDU93_001677 [Gonapodya sp. JEL0774]